MLGEGGGGEGKGREGRRRERGEGQGAGRCLKSKYEARDERELSQRREKEERKGEEDIW